MNQRWTQSFAVSIMRHVRRDLEREHARILRRDPGKLFDWQAIRAKAQEGEIAADNTDPVYLAVASKEAQSPDEAQRALLSAVRRGHQNVFKFQNHVGASSVTMFPFQPGNPGRPPGSRNRVTQMLEQLAAGHAAEIFQKVKEGALAGDVPCQKLLLDRIWPPRKAQSINVSMPPIKCSQDALAAIASICKALGEGLLTPDEITALSSVVGRSIQVIELQVERRLAALEEARDKRDEEKNS